MRKPRLKLYVKQNAGLGATEVHWLHPGKGDVATPHWRNDVYHHPEVEIYVSKVGHRWNYGLLSTVIMRTLQEQNISVATLTIQQKAPKRKFSKVKESEYKQGKLL